jgi:hypothetical protein
MGKTLAHNVLPTIYLEQPFSTNFVVFVHFIVFVSYKWAKLAWVFVIADFSSIVTCLQVRSEASP